MFRSRRLLGLFLLVTGGILSACQAGDSEETPTAFEATQTVQSAAQRAEETPSAQASVTARPTRTLPPPTPTPPPGYYYNPVFDQDFPDPDILTVEEDGQVVYYAYATNSQGPSGGQVHVQTARSTDLIQWTYVGDALPRLPRWVVQQFGYTWAPEVTRPAGGQGYVMYYTSRFAIEAGGVQCIGVATAETPEGPFTTVGEEPLVCQVGEGGSIDPAYFLDDDNTPYLLWKNDGNSQGGTTWIYIQRLSQDGFSLEGEATQLIRADKAWEGILVEGPTLWKHEGKYFLFYSANDYASPRYAVGYAESEAILGPYQKASEPLLKTNLKIGIVGPGGQDVVTAGDGQTWLLFHAWDAEAFRNLNLARLDWVDGKPVIDELAREAMQGP